MTLGYIWSEKQVKLRSLSLAGSTWPGVMGYAGYQLKQLNLSGTNIIDEDFKYITKVACTAPLCFKE